MIVAMAKNRVIGDGNGLPWGKSQKSDLKRFRILTENHTIVLGKNFYDELDEPLPNRKHIVITHHPENDTENVIFRSFEDALDMIKDLDEEIFITGGEQIYELFLPYADRIYLTEIDAEYDGKIKFPELGDEWREASKDCFESDDNNRHDYCFVNYEKITFS